MCFDQNKNKRSQHWVIFHSSDDLILSVVTFFIDLKLNTVRILDFLWKGTRKEKQPFRRDSTNQQPLPKQWRGAGRAAGGNLMLGLSETVRKHSSA